jgi:hypothetical protein
MADKPELVIDPRREDLPIIGRPIEFGGWSVAVSGICKCDRNQPLQLNLTSATDISKSLPGTIVQCPGCLRRWRLGPNTKVLLDVQLVEMAEKQS